MSSDEPGPVHAQLQQYLEETLGCGEFSVVHVAERTSRENYIIQQASGQRSILHTKKGQPTELYAGAIEFQMYLQRCGAPVAKTIGVPTYLDAADCSVQLCEFVDGQHLSVFKPEDAYALGQSIAGLHQFSLAAVAEGRFDHALPVPPVSRSLRKARRRQTLRGLGSYLKAIIGAKQHAPVSWVWDALRQPKDLVSKVHALPEGYTHGDLHASNLFYQHSEGLAQLVAYIDFEYANFRPLVCDIGDCIAKTICKDTLHYEDAKANVESLLAGYQSVRRLESNELQAIPLALRQRLNKVLLRQVCRWHRLSQDAAEQFIRNQACLRELEEKFLNRLP